MLTKTIFSGIQPTGVPHLGNYLGALKNWKKLQDEDVSTRLIYSIVGYHAITMPQNPKVLLNERRQMMATLLAIGLDPKRSIIFHQDQVPQHTELAWIFNCITPVNKLHRMTTWKSKIATLKNSNEESEVDDSDLNLGLLAYPVLQAADILLYKATHVPVGEDQQQHLELSRNIARHYNKLYKVKNYFPLPNHLITPTPRLGSLRDPTTKMSKSHPNLNSRILLTDTDTDIQKKIKSAVTDNIKSICYDPENRPGVSNLLAILAACSTSNIENLNELARGFKDAYDLKVNVTDALISTLGPIRSEYLKLCDDFSYLDNIGLEGKSKAQSISNETLHQVRKHIGLD